MLLLALSFCLLAAALARALTRDFFARLRIHPNGDWMLVANEASGNVVVFAIDKETGLLEPTGAEEGGMPTAMCVVFVPSTAAAL